MREKKRTHNVKTLKYFNPPLTVTMIDDRV